MVIRRSVLFVVIAALSCPVTDAAEPEDPRIVFGDTALFSCGCDRTVLTCSDLERLLKQRRGASFSRFVRNYLDSLGFFHAEWDTLPGSRYAVNPGRRAVVVAERIPGAPPAVLDSIPVFYGPRGYDAGDLRRRVAEIGRRMAEKGYPFAHISVSISSTAPDSLAVSCEVRLDRKCLFAAPQLIGAKATRRQILMRDVRVRTGELFDIRKIEATCGALLRRPYIRSAQAGAITALSYALRSDIDGGKPAADTEDVDYVSAPFFIKDRTGLGIEGALGFGSRQGEKNYLYGDLSISFLNLFRSGESAALRYAGDRFYQQFHGEASKPWLFGSPLTASASFGLEVHENDYGFLSGAVSVLAGLGSRDIWNAGIGITGTETTADSSRQSRRYFGADFLLSRLREQCREGAVARELSLSAGGGIAGQERKFTRSHVEFTGGIHVPFRQRQAVRVRVVSRHLITGEDADALAAPEMFRVGGCRSVRGYMENEFAFRTVVYDQLEYCWYYGPAASAYLFTDNGFGFEQSLTTARWGDRTEFLGYGMGIRIPARLGTLTLEWARNISRSDRTSWGRINVKISNNNSID
ncbi:MAG: BamA/TamA family outer membrane protein [Chitinispirillaceae bacterium]|nr:BamA/TamA family outer membrane protein [Chitinispirillaceae bacterium]